GFPPRPGARPGALRRGGLARAGAVVRRQGPAPGRAAVLPHGRLLRAVLRRRGSGVRGARAGAQLPGRAPGRAGADVRRAGPRARGLLGAADPARLPGGALRADGDAGGGQEAQGRDPPARGGAAGDAGHRHGRQPAGSGALRLAAGRGAWGGGRGGRRLARHLDRRFRNGVVARRAPARPPRPARTGRVAGVAGPGGGPASARRGAGHGSGAAARRGGAGGRRVRRFDLGGLRHLLRGRDRGGGDGLGLPQVHPAGRRCSGPPVAAGAARREGRLADGRRHPAQPGDPAERARRDARLPARRGGPHGDGRGRAGAGVAPRLPAGRSGARPGPARRGGGAAGLGPAADRPARRAARRARHGAGLGAAVARPLRAGRPGGDPRRA
ncbi:MAG: DNA mismatch repair protein MutS, partial [uncultured Acetobacteraceae bacterium]